jgi:hypothetical protein
MFDYFPLSVGVANVLDSGDRIDVKPAWITEAKGGMGFAQLAKILVP